MDFAMSNPAFTSGSASLRISCSTTELCRLTRLQKTPKDYPATPVATPVDRDGGASTRVSPERKETARRLNALLIRCKPDPASGCWVWQGAVQSRGYGSTANGRGGTVLVHRLSLELHGIDVPADMTVDHRCQNKLCANPAHLEVVPRAVNCARGTGKSPLYCKAGHPLFGALGAWRWRSDGKRRCDLCARATSKLHRMVAPCPEGGAR